MSSTKTTHRTTQKDVHVEHQDATDIHKKTIFVFLDCYFFIIT